MGILQIISTPRRTGDIRIYRDSNGKIISASADTSYGKLELQRILEKEREISDDNQTTS